LMKVAMIVRAKDGGHAEAGRQALPRTYGYTHARVRYTGA
jgi:hypothetical protein